MRNQAPTIQSLVIAAILLAMLPALGGCGENGMKKPRLTLPDVNLPKIKLPTIKKPLFLTDASPELKGIAHTPKELRYEHRRTKDTDMRQIWDDIDTIMLLNRPGRMSAYPIP